MSKNNSSPWLRSIKGQKDKVWCYTTSEGKQKSLGYKEQDKEKAFKKWHELLAAAGTVPQNETTNLITLIATFLATLLPRVSQHYHRCMGYTLNEFKTKFIDIALKEIKPYQIQDWIDGHSNWNDSSKCASKRHLVTFFKWLKFRELIDKLPTTDIRTYRPQSRGKEVLITDEEFKLFVSKCTKHFAALVMLLWQTGARPSELRCLQIDELDLTSKVIDKKQHKLKHKGKSRRILLTDEAVKLLTAVIGERKSGAVFLSREGKQWTKAGFTDRWQRARMKANLPPTWTSYAVRHCWCVSMCRRGVPAAVTATMMGHSSAKMIESVYGHMLDDIDAYRKWL